MSEDTGLSLTHEQFDEMLFHVRQLVDEEACGLVGGKAATALKVYPVTNALHSPTRFRMEARGQIKALMEIEHNGWDLLAIYHSHLKGSGKPSETDTAEFAYPGVSYLIFNLSGTVQILRGFHMIAGEWIEIPVVISN
jgi:proteasome lid subunit RPN8/RPN11